MDNVSEPINGPTFTIKFKYGYSLVTSDAYLNRVHNPDIGRIIIRAQDYSKLSKTLTVKDVDNLASPTDV